MTILIDESYWITLYITKGKVCINIHVKYLKINNYRNGMCIFQTTRGEKKWTKKTIGTHQKEGRVKAAIKQN